MSPEDVPDIAPEYASSEEVNWEHEGKALPEVLDPVMTKALIQRYIETERNRNRRALLWVSGIFLFVVLLILTMFLSIGIFVMKKSVAASDRVDQMKLQTSVYAAEVVAVSNDLVQLQASTQAIKGIVDEKEKEAEKKEALLKSDLKRFSKWVSSKNQKERSAIVMLEKKLKELESASESRQEEFENLKEKYEAAMKVAAGMPVEKAASAMVDPVAPTEDVSEPVEVVPVSPKAAPSAPRVSGGAVSVVSFPNGDQYKGPFNNGLFNGWGVYTYANGDRYEGDFEADMKSGTGTMFYQNGDKYIGSFAGDMPNGQGTMSFQDGERYVGDFSSGRISGKGTRHYKTGNKYEGDFKNGLRHGNGVLSFQNGDIYKGEFRDDKRTGKGTYIFTDGARYIGEFEDGQRHGNGRYIYAGGEEFIGYFRDGKREGVGLCIYPNGKQINGLWKNDEFIRVVEK